MAGRPEERTGRNGGGIPDGLLIGLLAFLLGLTLLAWTATGLAGLFAHGAWPEGVTLAETPLSIRRLVTAPHDLPAAWPNTPAGELSGYGLFWGLFIGELMVLVVLVIFVLGSVARWRAVRARRRDERRYGAGDGHGAENGSKAASVRSRQHQEPHHQAQPHAPAPAPIPAPAPAAPVEHTPAETTLLIETGSGSGSGSETPAPAPVLPRSPPPRAPRRLRTGRNAPPRRRPGRPGGQRPRARRHLRPHRLGRDEGRPRQARPGARLRPGPPLRYPSPSALVPHRGLRAARDGRRPRRRAPGPGPAAGAYRRGHRRHRRNAPSVLAACRRRRRPPLPPGPPLGTRRQRPRTGAPAPHSPQGGLRTRRPAGVGTDRPPRTPRKGPGADGTGLRRALLGPHP